VDVRIIAATNKDLKMEVGQGIFREDLFYRLNGFPLQLPPLRERQNDIPLLADHFLKKHGYHTVSSFSSRSMEILKMYRWPGNVRELENVVRRAAILAGSDDRNMIKESDIPEEICNTEIEPMKGFVYQPFEEQVLFLLRHLKFSRSAINQTARALDNRDRGTITEYFRGICFKMLVESDFSIDIAAKSIAASDDIETIERVKTKIREYLKNLRSSAENVKETDDKANYIKGLPQKYHTYIKQILDNFDRFF
jgi:transcriptional regulator with GAF, ATPase, and Fis domain